METRANYAMIGAFVILAALSALGFVLWLGQSQFNQDYDVYDIVFEGPVNLENGASVRYIGIKVGEVSWVRIDRGDQSKVRARIRVDAETPVKVDSTASIQLAGITGITFVQITAGSPKAAPLRARPGQPVPVIKAEWTQLDEIFAGGAEVLGKAMRFGAMIAVDAPDELAKMSYFPKKKELILTLRPEAYDLFGEVSEARFMSLASSLAATTQVKHAKS